MMCACPGILKNVLLQYRGRNSQRLRVIYMKLTLFVDIARDLHEIRFSAPLKHIYIVCQYLHCLPILLVIYMKFDSPHH